MAAEATPALAAPAMDASVARLTADLESSPRDQCGEVVGRWLSGLVAIYGETLPVEPIPMDDHDRISPLEELESMVGNDRVIVVESPENPLP